MQIKCVCLLMTVSLAGFTQALPVVDYQANGLSNIAAPISNMIAAGAMGSMIQSAPGDFQAYAVADSQAGAGSTVANVPDAALGTISAIENNNGLVGDVISTIGGSS